ncbi:MAG: ATP-binding cassette domain-containing protein [Acidimicrobiia bacterium]|nr:ATP-binding cassette domain-containing protein [Acidimicrobiia bacterium]
MALLEVEDLVVSFGGNKAVRGISLALDSGVKTGLIGESGCGKTVTALAILGLLPETATVSGSVRFEGKELLSSSEGELARLRGDHLGVVFQEPMTALNPMMRVGRQIAEVLEIHDLASRTGARRRAIELIEMVRLDDPEVTARKYPHQLSGGQRQRIVLAMALAGDPTLLIADEPTTALDVTVQSEILLLLDDLVDDLNTSLLLISHDLPLVASLCDELLVMYGGTIVERGEVNEVFGRPLHPYTAGLREASDLDQVEDDQELRTIEGSVPPLGEFPTGCVFRDRCEYADDECLQVPRLEVPSGEGHEAACFHPVRHD